MTKPEFKLVFTIAYWLLAMLLVFPYVGMVLMGILHSYIPAVPTMGFIPAVAGVLLVNLIAIVSKYTFMLAASIK